MYDYLVQEMFVISSQLLLFLFFFFFNDFYVRLLSSRNARDCQSTLCMYDYSVPEMAYMTFIAVTKLYVTVITATLVLV